MDFRAMRWAVFGGALALLAACASKNDVNGPGAVPDGGARDGAADAAADGGSGGRYGITADWLNKSLSIIDLQALKPGAKKKDVVVDTIDLSKYAPGPLEVAVTPDGKTALVSVSSGFFAVPGSGILIGASSIPSDPGMLLFIDIASRKVVAELNSGKGPMGIVFTPDGKKAFVAHFSDNQIAIIDVEKKQVTGHVTVGSFSEELALDDTGSVGIFSFGAAGNVRSFDVSDMAGTLSPDQMLTGDAAGVAFFPGTKIAYVVQAPNVLSSMNGGHNVIDVSKPKTPVVLEDVRSASAPVSYPAVAFPARNSVIVPAVVSSMLQLLEYKLVNKKAQLASMTPVTKVALFGAFHTSVDPSGRVLCALPREHLISVSDLATKKSFSVDWGGSQPGPTDVQVIP